MADTPNVKPETLVAQAAHYVDQTTGAVVPPIQLSTTFARDDDYVPIGGMTYARGKNFTYDQAEKIIANLEGGAASLLFASGLAACAAVFEALPKDGTVVIPSVMYHGAKTWLQRLTNTRGVTLIEFDAADPEGLERVLTGASPDLVWIEPAVNPTWDVIDIRRSAELAHAKGARLVVDSTVAPPCSCRPLALGADMVFHSATKYLNGHSDVVAGVLTTAKTDGVWDQIDMVRTYAGAILGPFEAALLLRGLRTLFIRFERASENAMAIARHFENHPRLVAVLYPGLHSHPGHKVAKAQMPHGFGGMMSLVINGDRADAQNVATRCRVFIPATSLGGVESLIEHRIAVEPEDSLVPDNLLRLSVGIEAVEDLIADLEQALEA